jgi:hypothetical protein
MLTVMALYAGPRVRREKGPKKGPKKSPKKGRGQEGGGLYPELALFHISEGCSPNVQDEVGRAVSQQPIRLAQEELARRGLALDEKATHRIANELGTQMLAARTRDLMRFREGKLPAGDEWTGKRIAVEIDGGRTRTRTIVQKTKLKGKRKRRKIRVEWREPKLVTIFELDENGKMPAGCRPIIDGTLRGPDALIELVAFHLHCHGAAKAKEIVFIADGAPWIWARLDWVIAQAKLDSPHIVQVLDFCHAAHHISLALQDLGLSKSDRDERYRRLRGLLKKGKAEAVLDELESLAKRLPRDREVWRAIRYLQKHWQACRLDYHCYRYRKLPIGSGAIESTIRRVLNLRLKGNGIYWKEENAEAMIQLRAAYLSGRWDERLSHTRAAMARNRKKDWQWTAPDALQELKALPETAAEDLKALKNAA